MKLLFDENLSPRLARSLADLYPQSAHIHDCSLGSADDDEVWQYAKIRGFSIVSKDSDFAERSVLQDAPPKVIWIRVGNCSTSDLERLLRSAYAEIRSFIEEDRETCLLLSYQKSTPTDKGKG